MARHRRRDHEKSGTYYDKLNQLVPDHAPQPQPQPQRARARAAPRTSGQFLSEVFTPRVPHKPQVLRTEVPSRLRFSSTYCPPRSKPPRPKSTVQGQDIGKDSPQPIWTASQASPPVSSRDSAYNGGISSGGESRGPTPDQKGSRKHSKRADKKGKKKIDQKRPHSVDAKSRRKLENKFMKKLLEDERNEIHKQRLRVDPWHGISQDDHGDEVLSNSHNSHIDSHVDDGLTEHRSPVDTGSVSDDSIQEDMAEDANEAAEEIIGGDGGDSFTEDKSSQSATASIESVNSQPPAKTSLPPSKQQAGTQTGTSHVQKKEMQPSNMQNSPSPSHSGQCSTASTSRTKQSNSQHLSSSTKQSSITSSLSDKEQESLFSQHEPEEHIAAYTSHHNLDSQKADADGGEEQGRRKQESKSSMLTSFEYERLLNKITKDLMKNCIVSNKGIKTVCQEHMEANCDKLDKARMQQEIYKLHTQLEVSDNYQGGFTIASDPFKKFQGTDTLGVIPFLKMKKLEPLTSQPSEPSQHMLSGVLDSQSKPIVTSEEEFLPDHGNLKAERLTTILFRRNSVLEELTTELSLNSSSEPRATESSYRNIWKESRHCGIQSNQGLADPGPSSSDNYLQKKESLAEEKRLVCEIESIETKLKSSLESGHNKEESFKSRASLLAGNVSSSSKCSPIIIQAHGEKKVTDPIFSDTHVCFCQEVNNCRCDSSGHFIDYLKSWLEKKPTMPTISARLQSVQNNLQKQINSGTEFVTSALNAGVDCECNEQEKPLDKVNFQETGSVPTRIAGSCDVPEVVTLYHKDILNKIAKEDEKKICVLERSVSSVKSLSPANNKVLSDAIGGLQQVLKENVHQPVTQEDICSLIAGENKVSAIGDQGTSNAVQVTASSRSGTKTQLEHESSIIPFGTGINSDINDYLRKAKFSNSLTG